PAAERERPRACPPATKLPASTTAMKIRMSFTLARGMGGSCGSSGIEGRFCVAHYSSIDCLYASKRRECRGHLFRWVRKCRRGGKQQLTRKTDMISKARIFDHGVAWEEGNSVTQGYCVN